MDDAVPMNQNETNILRALLFLALLIVLAGCATESKPSLAEQNIKSVAVMPPAAELWLATLKGRQRLPEQSKELQSKLLPLITAELEQGGLILAEPEPADNDPSDPAQLSPYFSWERTLATAYRSIDAQRPLEPEGPLLAKRAHADALLLTRAQAFKSSEGAKTLVAVDNLLAILAVAAGRPASATQSQRACLRVDLVDGTTGKVLWTGIGFEKDFERENLEKLIKQVFKEFPQ
jgi:hypothetical protein